MKSHLILCLDDEKIILDSLKVQLKSELNDDYYLEFSQDGQEGLEIIDEYYHSGVSVVVIVSDWLMPGMKGDEFLIRVNQKYKGVVAIMLSGHSELGAVQRAIKEANLFKLITKPWDKADLIKTIREGLEQNRKQR